MECYTPATMLQHASRTAEAAEVSISIRPCHTTRFWCGKMFHILHQHLFIPASYSLTSELWSSGPAEAAHVGGGAPFTP